MNHLPVIFKMIFTPLISNKFNLPVIFIGLLSQIIQNGIFYSYNKINIFIL